MSILTRQKTLKVNNDQSISVVGAGGIGFWVSKFIALAGIQKILIYDPDIYEEHNLNRIDIPYSFIGSNKSDVIKKIINFIRPDCTVYSFPFKYSEKVSSYTDWVVDCTDNYESQLNNKKISDNLKSKYVKLGYDGEHISINNNVAGWGESEDGYQITPSWVVPAVTIAALGVAKIMKYYDKELSCNISDFYYT